MWTKSTRCDSHSCLSVWPGHSTVWARDSADRVLVVDNAAWRQLMADAREGRLDRPGQEG